MVASVQITDMVVVNQTENPWPAFGNYHKVLKLALPPKGNIH